MDEKDQNNQEGKPNFQPAKNPFLSAVGISSQKSQVMPQEPKNKEVVVGNKDTTLVGSTAEQKSGSLNIPQPEQKVPEETLYQWQAPEFAFTQKPAGWYLAIFAFFIALGVLAFFFIGSDLQKYITIGLLLIMAVATSVWASRKPKVLDYTITNYGVVVNKSHYSFDDFRAFYVYMDYNQRTIDLVPGKRFGTLVSIPLASPEADEAIETIAHMIPEIEHSEDVFDRLVRRLRF